MKDDQRKRKIQWEWMCLLGRRDVVIVDTETTGTEVHDEIVELGWIQGEGGLKKIQEYLAERWGG